MGVVGVWEIDIAFFKYYIILCRKIFVSDLTWEPGKLSLHAVLKIEIP